VSFPLKIYLESKRKKLDAALNEMFRSVTNVPPTLKKSMVYSVNAGGKRLRPVLCLAAADAIGLAEKPALRLACALEIIHTYSLIHDDLPAMDDDDYRRGRLTNHKVFGEAMAILAGDALLTLAFEWAGDTRAYPLALRPRLGEVLWDLARSSGYFGMVGGQVADMEGEGKKPSLQRVLSIHRRKTGALLAVSTRLPSVLADSPLIVRKALDIYGRDAGLAFQIVDDVLNETGDAKSLGKSVGSDKARGKMTYPAAVGLDASREEIRRLTHSALVALKPLGDKAEPLRALAIHMAERTV
jgi:geranylgeranyl diphosphate synthase type II